MIGPVLIYIPMKFYYRKYMLKKNGRQREIEKFAKRVLRYISGCHLWAERNGAFSQKALVESSPVEVCALFIFKFAYGQGRRGCPPPPLQSAWL